MLINLFYAYKAYTLQKRSKQLSLKVVWGKYNFKKWYYPLEGFQVLISNYFNNQPKGFKGKNYFTYITD